MNAIQTLLRGSIDYAGLFPPSELDMSAAVSNFAQYGAGKMAWTLGRFIVPVTRLAELQAARERLDRFPAAPWRIGALAAAGRGLAGDLEQLDDFESRTGAEAFIADAVEVKADLTQAVREALSRLHRREAYIEIPIEHDPSELLASIADLGGRAKVRTGGVTADAFPRSQALVRFLGTCVRVGVPFKATAGLHHPLRGDYRLTYSPDSAAGTMFGFLNVFLATAFLKAGLDEAIALQLLEEQSPRSLHFEETGVTWREYRLTLDDIRDARESGIVSFGSCSFTEPIDDLNGLGFLRSKAQRA
jgi:hypothetical protein